MSLFDKEVWIGIGIGAAVVVTAPFVLPVVASVGRPLAKAGLRQGLLAYERGRELLARALEAFEDVIAEVRSEVEESLASEAGLEPRASEQKPPAQEARPEAA